MPVQEERTTQELWDSILAWLRGFDGGSSAVQHVRLVDLDTLATRGLVTTKDVPANTPLLTIPTSAQVNMTTLKPFYPTSLMSSLTATQLLSLHLALSSAQPSSKSRFGPFLETLPTSHTSVTLTWSIGTMSSAELRDTFSLSEAAAKTNFGLVPDQEKAAWKNLLLHLPQSVETRLREMQDKFSNDWKAVVEACAKDPSSGQDLRAPEFRHFLLAWLNVNTRCLYFDLGLRKGDNITLCPVIDMINHQHGLTTRPLQTPLSLQLSSPSYAASDPPLKAGVELHFSYGPHEDPMLLVEYGFIASTSSTLRSGTCQNNPYNNVRVDEVFERLFAAVKDGHVKKDIIIREGYWGDMTFQMSDTKSPSSAGPSWRVLVALRLLHLPLPRAASSTQLDRVLEPFHSMLRGEQDVLSASNESLVRSTVVEIAEDCEATLEEGRQAFLQARKISKISADDDSSSMLKDCWDMVGTIWDGELEIVRGVLSTSAN